MAGAVEYMPSTDKNTKVDHRMIGGVYVVADGDSDSDEYDDNETGRNGILLPQNVCDIDSAGLQSKTRIKSMKKKKGIPVSNKKSSFARRPVDFMCSTFPTDANSMVGVDVSCGAMNAFSRDVPYNSAGLSLASPQSSVYMASPQNSARRRRRPIAPAFSPSSNNDDTRSRRRLMASHVNIPTRSRKAASPGVERFNYAKALLRSDHELEKLSRRIRSEINESELFELAQAAEKAANSGVDNFSGRASTFGRELATTKTGLPVTEKKLFKNETATHSTSAKIPHTTHIGPSWQQESARNDNQNQRGSSGTNGLPEQSLLEHARAAAAAVVVAAPAIPSRTTTTTHIRKEPEKRSMRIDSLRNVNEVIPRWNELHSQMRTHFYRSNVETSYLFFCETESSPNPSNGYSIRNSILPSRKKSAEDKNKTTNHQQKKSFFDNIASIKLLPDFRPNKSQLPEVVDSQPDDDTNTNQETERKEFGTILSSHISTKEHIGRTLSPSLTVPPGLAHPDEYNSNGCDSRNLEVRSDFIGQSTSLTPRLPKRAEIFDEEVLQITRNLPAKYQETKDCNGVHDDEKDDDNIDVIRSSENQVKGPSCDHRHVLSKAESRVASPDHESICTVSPSNESMIDKANPQHAGSFSPTAPSTPKNNMNSYRKDIGFSTPAHLRMIKRQHSSNDNDKSSTSDNCLEQKKNDDFHEKKYHGEEFTTTPSGGVYSQYEPNSIVRNSPEGSHHLAASPIQNAERTHLAIPTIRTPKSDTERKNHSRSFVRRKVRTQWQNNTTSPSNSLTTPTIAVTENSLRTKTENIGSDYESPPSVRNIYDQSHLENYNTTGDQETLSSSKLINCMNPPHDTSALQPPDVNILSSEMRVNLDENSVRKIQYSKSVDEKKECDYAAPSINSNGHDEVEHKMKIDHTCCALDSSPISLRDTACLIQGSNDGAGYIPLFRNKSESDCLPKIEESNSILTTTACHDEPPPTSATTKTIDSNQTTESKEYLSTNSFQRNDAQDGRNRVDEINTGENVSVCHSLPSTEVTFKSAVQTVQGVAVQTVQEVFSHLSLASPKHQLQSKIWQSEVDNKEYLSNYFYCAKAIERKNLQESHSAYNNLEEFIPSETNIEGFVCTEPCSGRDSCFSVGIDTMCGGLIDLLPNDVTTNSRARNSQRKDRGEVSYAAATRDRSSSISMDQINRGRRNPLSGIDSQRDEGTWIGMFQRVASERFNIQFQNEENELEKSKHPYTPPCLSRKVQSANHTL